MSTFNEIRSEVKRRIGNRTDVEDRLGTWINDAYFDLLMEPEYSFHELDRQGLIITESGKREYSLNVFPDLWFILGVRDNTTEREVLRVHWKTFDRRAHTEGAPTRYTRFGSDIIFDPTPDGIYNILLRYRNRVNEMVAGTSPVIPREWHSMLTHLAVVKAYEGLEQFEKAAAQRQLVFTMEDNRKDQVELEDEDHENSIRVRLSQFGA